MRSEPASLSLCASQTRSPTHRTQVVHLTLATPMVHREKALGDSSPLTEATHERDAVTKRCRNADAVVASALIGSFARRLISLPASYKPRTCTAQYHLKACACSRHGMTVTVAVPASKTQRDVRVPINDSRATDSECSLLLPKTQGGKTAPNCHNLISVRVETNRNGPLTTPRNLSFCCCKTKFYIDGLQHYTILHCVCACVCTQTQTTVS